MLCQVVCVWSASMSTVSGDTHTPTCVFGSFSEVGCITTFSTALTEALKVARSTPAFSH